MSLSEKITPEVRIGAEPCCPFITSQDEEGFSAIMKNMTLDEYIDQQFPTNGTSGGPGFLINTGPIVLDGNLAYKIVAGFKDTRSIKTCTG